MLQTFLATLTPMLTLFTCIAIGFIIKKANILPDNASSVIAKLITWVLYPALSFSTMARFFTINTIKVHMTNIIMCVVSVTLAVLIAIPLSYIFVRKRCYERNIYIYAMTFANSGYMGDPLVQAIFGEEVLSYYKLAGLPISILIYTWGISLLVPKNSIQKGCVLKKIFNPSLIAMFFGMATGLICGTIIDAIPAGSTAYDMLLPKFIISTLDSLKTCMGPTAMLLAGVTIAKYNFAGMFKKKKVYIATMLRLIVIPAIILSALFGIKELVNLIFALSIDNTSLILLFFAIATPLGLNTIVFPESYGGNPETGASMTMISHTLCVITIPLMFALVCAILGSNTWLPL